MQPLSNSDTDATNRHSTISQTIQQPLSNPAPTIGNLNPSTTVLQPPDGRFRAWQTSTTQPSFVSNPRTIPTQPSHIRDPDNTELHGLGSSINCLGCRVASYTIRDAKKIAKLLAVLP